MKRELEFHAGRLPGHADPDQEVDRLPINYLELALRFRWWLVCGCAAGLLLGAAAYVKFGPEYEGTAQVLVSRKNAVPVKEDQRALGNWGDRSEHIALILSPMIAGKAVELGHLTKLSTFRSSTDPTDDVLDGLKVKRSAGQDRSFINVLNITYNSKQAADARAVVEAVIAAYAQYLEETRHEQSQEVLALATKARDDMLEKLHAKERDYLKFRESAPLTWRTTTSASLDGLGMTTNVHQERVLFIEEQRRQGLIRQAELRSRLVAIEQAVAAGESRDSLDTLVRRFLAADGPNSGDQQRLQEIAAFENKLLPLLLEEKRLTQDYGKDHPEVKTVRKSIDTTIEFYRQHGIRLPDAKDENGKPLRSPAPDFIVIYQNSLKQQLAELKIRNEELTESFEHELVEAKKLSGFQAQDQALNSEIAQIRELWEQLTTQVNQIDIEKDSNGYTLKQLAPVRSQISWKRLIKFLAAGAAAGMGMVGVWVFLREWQDTTLKTSKELQFCLRQPILGGMREFLAPEDFAGPESGRPHPALRYWHAPNSPEAEHIRSIRSALAVAAEGRQAKVIQVSSPEPGDGKTTLVANLAIAEAQAGKRVLLIDADMRRPCLHKLFRVPHVPGLSEVLMGSIAISSAARNSPVDGLTLLTAGTPPVNPAEMLSSSRWLKLVRELRPEFDLILVDSPPLLAVSDPCEIARQVDGLLLVMRLGKNRRPAAIRTRELIHSHNLPLLGVVANGLTVAESAGYGDYHDTLPDVKKAAAVKPRAELELVEV